MHHTHHQLSTRKMIETCLVADGINLDSDRVRTRGRSGVTLGWIPNE